MAASFNFCQTSIKGFSTVIIYFFTQATFYRDQNFVRIFTGNLQLHTSLNSKVFLYTKLIDSYMKIFLTGNWAK